MKRRTSLIAVVAALFTLQAPLCALACFDTPEPAAVASHDSMPPCHAENRTDTSPQAPASHEDCGCEATAATAIASTADSLSLADSLAVAPFAAPTAQRFQVQAVVRTLPIASDLPPPDLVLLNRSFLI